MAAVTIIMIVMMVVVRAARIGFRRLRMTSRGGQRQDLSMTGGRRMMAMRDGASAGVVVMREAGNERQHQSQ